ncbi:DNA repair protein RAD51 homolog 4-like isoform X2 [Zingiber officinale]|uniref:DNA repair protein RAD51 homolog 4-like isoform X2 n=1 Tax=Zingiber officinale TaxID=94328 RepID=UPI001C4D637F|nr:DNA repair protein RAD51 homolog 4-like isoform X2 [Zingiber officinale]
MCSRQPPWFNGLELLEDAKQNKHVLPSGCEGIDILLEGGFRIGQLTEIVGPSSSGKTQICLRSALGVADMNLGSVFFLDTCNSFSSNRIASMINQHTATSVEEDEETRVKRIMSRILCQSVYDIFELLDILRQLENRLSYQEKSNGNSIRLLIIDSIATLIAPIIGSKNSQGRMLTISTGILLKRIANDYNLSVLVTNQMVGGQRGHLKPALGESWKSIPHVQLLLSRDKGNTICGISILKHTTIGSGRTGKFVIHN